MSQSTLRTPAEVRAWLERHGVTISEWARRHGFKPAIVSALLAGRTRGHWGEAHEAAILLGLRPAPAYGEEHPLATSISGLKTTNQRLASGEEARMI
jgi:gp16 family phage-associated protein